MGDMEMRSADKIELEKGDEDSRSYHAPNVPSNWQFSGSNLIASSMGLISAENPIAIHRGDVVESSSCSTASMVDSFCPTIWDQPTTNSQNMFSDLNVQNNASSSSTLGFRKGNLGPPRTDLERALDMGWTPETSMLKQTMLLPTSSGMIPQSLSQFPADTGFIERAARFSCFSGGKYTDMVNPFSIPESMSPYSRGATPMQGLQKVDDRLNSVTGGQSRKNEMSMVECSNDNPMPIEHEGNRGPPLNHVRNSENFLRSHDQANQDLYEPSNDSDEAELVTGGAQAEPSAMDGTGGGTPAKTHGLKKRKRPGQDAELQQATGASNPPEIAEDDSGIPLKQDHNATSTINKPGGKHGKHVSQASDSNKEDYIHVRARRGQATNSHSLAERVRREKISERMKYLQDLVPGCSKVTGKAVMLDEIINYVQSLQRQVEFLSMKLATVNPRPDFNIEGLLAKDILQSRAGPSSAIGFHPDMRMPYAPMHLSQHGLIQSGLAGMGASPDALRRTITSHLTAVGGGYKEPNSQVPNVWEDELHNIVQMGLNSNITLDEEDLVGPTSHLKAEL